MMPPVKFQTLCGGTVRGFQNPEENLNPSQVVHMQTFVVYESVRNETHEINPKIFISNVPKSKATSDLKRALKKAGLSFQQCGVEWANHRVTLLADAPPEIQYRFEQNAAPLVSWQELINPKKEKEEKEVLFVRTSRVLAARVREAAAKEGKSTNLWIQEVLAQILEPATPKLKVIDSTPSKSAQRRAK